MNPDKESLARIRRLMMERDLLLSVIPPVQMQRIQARLDQIALMSDDELATPSPGTKKGQS